MPADDVKIKAQVYKDPRPAETFAPYHARVRDHPPEWIYEIVRGVTVLNALVAFRAEGYGSEHVPNGPVILAPNHASFMDHFFAGAFIRRHVQFMAKSQMFGPNPLSWVYSHGGVFPVRRGHHDEDAFASAFRILDEAVQIHGKEGLTQGNEVEFLFRKVRMFRVLTGTSEIQKNGIAKLLAALPVEPAAAAADRR